jgi:hypothetical protein
MSCFSNSSSIIIKRNADLLNNFYSKCKKKISSVKSSISFDHQFWTTFTITMICSVLKPIELYEYLVEIGFIDNTVSSKCKACAGRLTVVIFLL